MQLVLFVNCRSNYAHVYAGQERYTCNYVRMNKLGQESINCSVIIIFQLTKSVKHVSVLFFVKFNHFGLVPVPHVEAMIISSQLGV
jgi:hypothetical protein